ncbi:hypothetical protein LOAG_03758 [Loa loa]|uniref:Uncharacterized protein n=1 Tax=Loa loa TaxID=7209 RepID=A0A1S0U3E2_LOALO|nr:hypothetical protein LOAG_03758 [Loa loa]EFO24723.1 hypothetical protein LOAG_03758 [Loa loa]
MDFTYLLFGVSSRDFPQSSDTSQHLLVHLQWLKSWFSIEVVFIKRGNCWGRNLIKNSMKYKLKHVLIMEESPFSSWRYYKSVVVNIHRAHEFYTKHENVKFS